jgi:hypothetical protein
MAANRRDGEARRSKLQKGFERDLSIIQQHP